MKTPAACNSLSDVRSAIDQIDEQLIALLGLRADYVRNAARFKSNEAEVAAPDRLASMLRARREWAERERLDPDFVERLYRDLVAHFIELEKRHLPATTRRTE